MNVQFHEREQPISVKFGGGKTHIDVDFNTGGGGGIVPRYHGEYEVTPSEETQILSTAHTQLAENVVVNPVPSNYARMAWNGTTLLFY